MLIPQPNQRTIRVTPCLGAKPSVPILVADVVQDVIYIEQQLHDHGNPYDLNEQFNLDQHVIIDLPWGVNLAPGVNIQALLEE